MLIAIAIVAIILLAVVGLVVSARKRSTTGTLSRETVKRDEAAGASSVPEGVGAVSVAADTAEARQRAAEARQAIESGASAVPEPVAAATPAVYEPLDLDELGVTRRQFFNRSLLAGSGLGLGAFGVASLAFLWGSASGGLSGDVVVGSEADAKAAFDNKQPLYNAGAKTYIVAYPKEDLPKAKKVYDPAVFAGMEQGYVALFQKCVHLGCRVPWCQSSQWFECPCHGSKYNRVGEKQGGPAPRGLDRFAVRVEGGNIVVDTSTIIAGPPLGVDTTSQSPEGAPCV